MNKKYLLCQKVNGVKPLKPKLVKSPLLKHKKNLVKNSNQKLFLPSPELRYKAFASHNRGLDKFYKDRQDKIQMIGST